MAPGVRCGDDRERQHRLPYPGHRRLTGSVPTCCGKEFVRVGVGQFDGEAALNSAGELGHECGAAVDRSEARGAGVTSMGVVSAGRGYSTSRFGTSATCLMFSESQPSGAKKSQLASPTGFEAETPDKPSSQPVDQTRRDGDLREEPGDGSGRE